ncbi:tyrosine-type recombinase/integrase [Paenibacillus oleatilyticus]|uniref:tyrosine-type recombinase/integrase n=1 Tax=Paenibacillus oleatilyticus TaxID=2594886 RepID=UPI001C201284|nr:tyrosine-type recombinase/integrase [Paenibacillus oleatilyticus]MBU7316129.1 tyrosine-type recombinase/integrase [Paenibacillus oleatilyticus]
MQAATVQSLNIDSTQTDIMIWANKYKGKSRTEYLRDANEFFYFMHGRRIDEISKTEIETINENGKRTRLLNKHVEKYKQYLKERNSDSSIRRKIYGIRSLYKFLRINGYDVDHMIFETSTLKKKTKGYGFYSPVEVKRLATEALKERDGEELSTLILLAATTSLRLNALLGLEWLNIIKHEESGLYLVNTIDKGDQEATRPFEQDLFDKLFLIRNRTGSDKLFPNLKPDKVEKSIIRLNERLGLNPIRKLRFHSLRKAAIKYEMRTTGNLRRAKDQGGHNSAQVLLEDYTEAEDDYASRAGILMMKTIDESVFDSVGKEELLCMIKEINYGVYQQLAYRIQKRRFE